MAPRQGLKTGDFSAAPRPATSARYRTGRSGPALAARIVVRHVSRRGTSPAPALRRAAGPRDAAGKIRTEVRCTVSKAPQTQGAILVETRASRLRRCSYR